MKLFSENIQVKKTARYYANEVEPGNVETIWFLLHGYSQLAENFIKKFPLLDNGKNHLIAPEALSRFYIDNGFGKTGASWMTKEDRENEIDDYVCYLTDLYELTRNQFDRNTGLNVLGFSQGTSTVSRWLQRSGIKADKLILWGGFLPPDFDLKLWEKSFESLLIVAGSDDEFLTKEKLAEGKELLDKHLVNYSLHLYDGGHEMKEKAVNEVLNGKFL